MRSTRRRRRIGNTLLIALVLGGYGYWTLGRPLPALQPEPASSITRTSNTPSKLNWPSAQAAAGVLGTDILETRGVQTPVPTASTAKIITALVVLDKKPLLVNESGPTLTLTAADVDSYRTYLAQDGSVVPVQAGEKLTQYQAMQAMLLPSANNIADTLAIWAYGSLPAYAAAANTYLAEHSLKDTRVGSDASGLAPDTTSTAHDLVKIGKLAMQNPLIAQVVGQSSATGIPLTTEIRNVNNLLGNNGIIGIKTGTSDQAGGAFVGAAQTLVNGKPEIIITAVLQTPDRATALRVSQALIQSAQTNFSPLTIIKKGTAIGTYRLPWGGSVKAVADRDLRLSIWNGSKLSATPKLDATDQTPAAGEAVGRLTTQNSSLSRAQTVTLKLISTPNEPSILWRLTHPQSVD